MDLAVTGECRPEGEIRDDPQPRLGVRRRRGSGADGARTELGGWGLECVRIEMCVCYMKYKLPAPQRSPLRWGSRHMVMLILSKRNAILSVEFRDYARESMK